MPLKMKKKKKIILFIKKYKIIIYEIKLIFFF